MLKPATTSLSTFVHVGLMAGWRNRTATHYWDNTASDTDAGWHGDWQYPGSRWDNSWHEAATAASSHQWNDHLWTSHPSVAATASDNWTGGGGVPWEWAKYSAVGKLVEPAPRQPTVSLRSIKQSKANKTWGRNVTNKLRTAIVACTDFQEFD